MTMGAFFSDHWGDLASVAGLLLALIGFGVTLWQVWKSRQASEAASLAISELKHELTIFDLATEMARAKAIMEEIKRLHRADSWHMLPDRYQAIRECLVQIRDCEAIVRKGHQGVISSVIRHFQKIEERVEKSLNTKIQSPSVTNLNTIVSEQHEKLTEIFASVKADLGN